MSTASETVSFVIVTMNRPDELRRCLQSVENQTYAQKEIIVVDNAATPAMAALFAEEFPAIRYLPQPHNTGAAGGKNIGMQAATGTYIICLDDDEAFSHDNVGQLVVQYFTHHPQVAALSFNVIDPATGQTHPRSIPRRDKRMLHDDTPIGYFLGCGCAFRRDALDTTGYYWEALNPFGAEEFDLSIRLLEAGYGLLWTKSIPVLHYESPTARPGGRKVYALARNTPLVALRHLPWPQVISHYALWWGYAGWLALRGRQWKSWLRGCLASLRDAPKALALRRPVSRSTCRGLRRLKGPYWF